MANNGEFEVLSPWAVVDPIPLRGITPRLTDLNGKTIGLFANGGKRAARPILNAVEAKLKERFPGVKFSRYDARERFFVAQMEGKDRTRFQEWVNEVDAVIGAVGD